MPRIEGFGVFRGVWGWSGGAGGPAGAPNQAPTNLLEFLLWSLARAILEASFEIYRFFGPWRGVWPAGSVFLGAPLFSVRAAACGRKSAVLDHPRPPHPPPPQLFRLQHAF